MVAFSGLVEMTPKSQLIDYLESQWKERGTQRTFTRKMRLSEGAPSKWKAGQAPDFESCLKIAQYYRLDPYQVFEWAGRKEFRELAQFLGIEGGMPPEPWRLYTEPKLAELHRQLDVLTAAGLSGPAEELIGRVWRLIDQIIARLAKLRKRLEAPAAIFCTREGALIARSGEVTEEEQRAAIRDGQIEGWISVEDE